MATAAEYRQVLVAERAKVVAGKAAELSAKILKQLQGELIGDSGVPPLDRSDLHDEYEQAIGELSSKEKAVETLTFDELVNELKTQRIDVVAFAYGTGGDPGRKRELVNEFIKRGDPLSDRDFPGIPPQERLRLLAIKTDYLLGRLDGKLDANRGEATVPRNGAIGSQRKNLEAYMPGISRKHLLLASTYHPVWGQETREIINWLTTKPALRAGMVGYIPGVEYAKLTNADGRQVLERWINMYFPAAHPEAKKWAQLLFTSLDMLTIVLQERDGWTDQTRYHNQDETLDPDPVKVNAPLHAWAYSAFRYGGNEKDYLGWVSIFYPPIPDGRFGPGGNASRMRMLQELCLEYERLFYPTNAFEGKIPIPAFGQSVSPDTKSIVFLGSAAYGDLIDNEVLDVPGVGLIDKNGPSGAASEKISTKYIEHETAFTAFGQLMDLTFKWIKDNLSEEEIMAQVSGMKGGLLYQWLSIAGRAKAFQPGYLKQFIEPMLTRYCLSLVQRYKGDKKDRQKLVGKMQQAIRDTSTRSDTESLRCYRAELERVINNLNNSYVVDNGRNARVDKLKGYLDSLYQYNGWHRPSFVEIAADWTSSTDEHVRLYLDYIKQRKFPPPPISSHGSMIQEKK